MPLADLKTLIGASAQNLSQFKAISAAYGSLFGGTPSIDGYTFLISNNNSTNFGAGPGVLFNDENVYINVLNALYQGNQQSRAIIDSIVSGSTTNPDALTAIYNYTIPLSLRTPAGLEYFKSQASFYVARAAELGIPGQSGMAVVALASLIKIATDSDIGGIGDTINDLRIAIDNGSAQIPQSSFATTVLEKADGTGSDADDVAIGGFTPGVSFNLTADVDAFKGGTADDTFVASLTGPSANLVSLSASDILVGGIGNDRLSVTGLGNLTTTSTTLSNIETIQLIQPADGQTLNLAATSGIRAVSLDSPKGSYTVQGLGAGVTSVSINQPSAGSVQTFKFQNSAVSGQADAINVNMSGTGGVFHFVTLALSPEAGSNGIETVTLNSSLNSVVLTIEADTLNNLYINNDKTAAIIVRSAGINNIDGSNSSIGQSLIVYGSALDRTIKTGSGNDFIAGGVGIDTITTGAGVDQISLGSQSNPANLVAANRDIVLDFKPGVGGDVIQINDQSDTKAVTFSTVSARASSYTVTSGLDPNYDAANVTVFNLPLIPLFTDQSLDPAAGGASALNGTNLLKLLGVGSTPATLTAQADTQQGYLVAYSGGNAYLYYFIDRPGAGKVLPGAEVAGSATLQAEEINLVGVLLNVGTSSLTAANFL